MRVVIVGAGKVGMHIASDLAQSDHDVVVVERDRNLVARKQAASGLEHVEFVVGDACEIAEQDLCGLETADVVVAATGEDQVNLVVSLLAKQEYAVPRVIARVNHPRNQWLFNESWGVDVCVSTPHLLTALVEEAVSIGHVVNLLDFEGGGARLVEVTLAESSPAAGMTVSELRASQDIAVVAIVRDRHVITPDADDQLEVGDEVLMVVTAEDDDEVRRLLVREA